MITDDLLTQGYSVQRDFLNSSELKNICEEMSLLYESGAFKSSAIGNHNKITRDASVRSDEIYWLDSYSPTPPQSIVLSALEKIRLECNEKMFLGLLNFEGHYAVYSKNSFYQKHFDSFKDDDSRVLSVVIYFNEWWKNGDGGELALHTKAPVIVEPRAGTLVVFLSHQIEHEVLPAHEIRRSFSGWFKRRAT